MRRVLTLALAATALVVLSCARRMATQAAPDKPVVFVSVLPQAYLAERIADGHAEVEVLVPPGQEPHTYEPTPKQMTRLSEARVFFRIGVPFEDTLVPKLSSGWQLRIVDTTEGIERIASTDEDEPGMDPHTWTSLRLAKAQAAAMCRTFVEIDPSHRSDYEANLRKLDADLDELDAEIAAALAPLKGRTFFVFHPAFGYFARDYGLKQEAVETGGKAPGPRHVKELIDKARAEGVRVIFVEPQFSRQAAEAIAREIGGAVVSIDPLAGDYLANMRRVAHEIRDALVARDSGPSDP